ncbi:hypothetical protein HanXRQr2_Chr12g0550581 [Helianthus annuus]|uniref:Uncharacterized protein n=1 Tax=Helianthus annuus TaxID=4232 RepID=A0A9K3MWX8_HELAN|nr:hypothetical protein HanXRQr2_Chr12g0550581 [Helianthus annuus]KAJ0490062.1 hypothetical protein HanHA300_Chr12g0451121 [Helianthus annuus]KAJ0675646.1 hypothetical protein HanLR1_Chr12g0453541 [Helianthus annuus]KAJ0678923.1 hypothetical protein HanOQP8_Chr12g0453431 [Helianthus annuus]KAJ0863446.1 hypothetical protein HanPSC8_Chr12g0530101 [Helianthus annuus]
MAIHGGDGRWLLTRVDIVVLLLLQVQMGVFFPVYEVHLGFVFFEGVLIIVYLMFDFFVFVSDLCVWFCFG